MHADRGGVDHLQIAVVTLRDSLENPVPHAQLPPPHKAVVAGRGRPVALGDIRPGGTGSEPPIDAVEHAPIVRPRDTARLVGQNGFYDRPFEIRKFVAALVHQGSSVEELESLFATNGNAFYEFVT